ncbi:DoxX family protein [Paenibacillus sp. ATY16]|uniref:DoxX family protein n=1 Tax=Paenibacillus sp. ATY16 TaxID=1759312 RepID=UPI00200DE573|nr:DoxX family protein [Paenibacillus sp. ATY16]MCK9861690.1 DoxX family protein [Paenibacillus sp. ATY16]
MSKTVGAVTAVNAGTKVQGKTVAYWSVTLLLAAALTLSGLGQLMKVGGNVDLVTNLGYPLYIMQILGVWKLLGVIAVLAPRFPRLKEWTHAGIFFLMTGATISHLLDHDYGVGGFNVILPLFYAALNIASWALRPENRKL